MKCTATDGLAVETVDCAVLSYRSDDAYIHLFHIGPCRCLMLLTTKMTMGCDEDGGPNLIHLT